MLKKLYQFILYADSKPGEILLPRVHPWSVVSNCGEFLNNLTYLTSDKKALDLADLLIQYLKITNCFTVYWTDERFRGNGTFPEKRFRGELNISSILMTKCPY